MSYAAAIDGLFALAGELHTAPGQPRRKFRIEDMRVLMAALGDPQREFRSVLIAGTNGKGSTASTLASIVREAGYTVGLYTSPHLSRVNERIQIAGAPIGDDDFAALYFRVDDVSSRLVREGQLPAHPSFFETMTALAFLAFAARRVDLAVLEVGMGGRLDATNIVDPIVSVITDISLDHTEWLGSTIAAIAREKAGILRAGGVMVTLAQHPEANQAIGEAATALGVRGVNAAAYIPPTRSSGRSTHNRYQLHVLGENVDIDSPLEGAHQQRNLALAIAAAVELSNSHGYNIMPLAISAGIRSTVWPARLERFSRAQAADLLLDVGHNPAGAWALRSAISSLLPEDVPGQPLTLIFGCLRDKPVAEMAQILFPLFDQVILTPVDSPRAAPLEQMIAAAEATGSNYRTAPDAATALQLATSLTSTEGLIVGTGSVYLVGRLRELVAPAAEGAGRT